MASNRIKQKYQKQRQKGSLKKQIKKQLNKQPRYLETNYNNDTNINDLEIVDYNNDTNINDLGKLTEKNIWDRNSCQKIIKEYRNVARKKRYWRRDKRVEEDVAFVKQVPVHPKDKLARKVRDQFKDLGTVDYNNDTNIGDLGTKKISRTLVAAKKIVKNTEIWQGKNHTNDLIRK